MSQYTDDPIADYDAYDAEQQQLLKALPECDECGEPITDEYCFEVNGDYICEKCMEENHRKAVEDIE